MDIHVQGDGRYFIGVLSQLETKANTDGSITLQTKGGEYARDMVNVSTNSGTFVEALDANGTVIIEGGDGEWLWVPVDKPVTLRVKKLPPITLSKSQLDKKRNKVTRYLVSDRPYNLELPDTLPGVIGWLEKKLKEIPEASRAKASFEFTTDMAYGDTYPQIEISYTEAESDEEVVTRLQIEAERTRIAEAKERDQLERLRTKYEPA